MIVLQDRDLTLHQGDVRAVLAELEPGSVDCVVTSPPYWGLRDYGTGAWAGGDPDCDHIGGTLGRNDAGRNFTGGGGNREGSGNPGKQQYADVCGKCGARRVDSQIGLEPTPDAYVAGMVEVFRQVRRVLAPHGTCWVNLGDSYASGAGGSDGSTGINNGGRDGYKRALRGQQGRGPICGGLKPKDLCMIPARVAIALQADCWYLRSDIIWSKPNPMPESVTDRPTSAYEHVFLLTRQPRYWFDAEAVREPHARLWESNNGGSMATTRHHDAHIGGSNRHERPYPEPNPAGRNIRNVWEIATQPYPDAHFATYPEELVRRCLLAGCPLEVCRRCAKPRERIVERKFYGNLRTEGNKDGHRDGEIGITRNEFVGGSDYYAEYEPPTTVDFTDCGHGDYRPGVVLDPFAGSGTTLKVARDHGRHSIGIELSPAYVALIARRVQQLSLLAEARR